ncbi:MAG: PAS domain-containing protein [Ferrovibrio sp.]
MLTVGSTKIETVEAPDALADERLRRLYALWLEAHDENLKPPGRAFVDPLRLRFIIGNIMLIDVQPEPLRFHYRLAGTDVVDHLGVELTGLWLEQHPDTARIDEIATAFTLAWRNRCAVHVVFRLSSFKQVWPCEALVLPLSPMPGEMPLLMVGQIFPKDMPRFSRRQEDETG